MADLDILHAQRLPHLCEDARPVDFEPEAFRIEIGGAEPRVGLVRVAGALRVRVERDDPVVGTALDRRCGEEASFVKVPTHLAGELPPDLLLARPEEGFEQAHSANSPAFIVSSAPIMSPFLIAVGPPGD